MNMNLTQFHATKAQANRLARTLGLQYRRTFSDSRKGGWRYKFWQVTPGETANAFFTALCGLFAHQENVTVYFENQRGHYSSWVNFYVRFKNMEAR